MFIDIDASWSINTSSSLIRRTISCVILIYLQINTFIVPWTATVLWPGGDILQQNTETCVAAGRRNLCGHSSLISTPRQPFNQMHRKPGNYEKLCFQNKFAGKFVSNTFHGSLYKIKLMDILLSDDKLQDSEEGFTLRYGWGGLPWGMGVGGVGGV